MSRNHDVLKDDGGMEEEAEEVALQSRVRGSTCDHCATQQNEHDD